MDAESTPLIIKKSLAAALTHLCENGTYRACV
jgi:hypothetical protein